MLSRGTFPLSNGRPGTIAPVALLNPALTPSHGKYQIPLSICKAFFTQERCHMMRNKGRAWERLKPNSQQEL